MHATQLAYAIATAAYDHAVAEADDAISGDHTCQHVDGESDEAWEAVEEARDATKEVFGVYLAMDARTAASRAMVAWSCEHARRMHPEYGSMISETMEAAWKRPVFWKRLVDMAFTLHVDGA